MKLIVLGCGTSTGVPRLAGEGGPDWGECDPAEPKNYRTRCSLLVRRHGPDGVTSVLIDTSPDLRAQMLAANVRHVDAVLYTHDHADQVHGIDDLRVFAMRTRRRIPAWMDTATRDALIGRFPYIFKSQEGYPAILDEMAIPPHGETWSVEGPGGSLPVVTFDQAHGPIRSVRDAIQWAVFLPNTPATRADLKSTIASFLYRLWKEGALDGATWGEAFSVQCDSQNNTDIDVRSGLLTVDVQMRPVFPAEFIRVRFRQSPMRSEVSE